MSEDQKNFIIDMLKSEGWKFFEKRCQEATASFRILATQPPEAVSDSLRTYYSGIAAGVEQAIDDIKGVVK